MISTFKNIRPSYMPKYVPDSSCVLYLEGQQDPKSGTIKDLSGYGNHGTIEGATWSRLPSGLWVQYFDGNASKITLPTSPTILLSSNTALTCMCWAKFDSVTGGVYRWAINLSVQDWNKNRFTFGISNSNRLEFQIADNASTYLTKNFGSAVPSANIWYLITCTLNLLGNGYIYRNTDVSSAQLLTTLGTFVQSGSPLIGFNTGEAFLGYLTLPRIFNRALSATEIAGIYRNERYLFGV